MGEGGQQFFTPLSDSHPLHHRSCHSREQEKIRNSLNSHSMSADASQLSEIYMRVSVHLDTMLREHLKCLHFLCANQSVPSFEECLKHLCTKLAFLGFHPARVRCLCIPIWSQAVLGKRDFKGRGIQRERHADPQTLTHWRARMFSFQSWSCEIFFDFLSSVPFSPHSPQCGPIY